MQSHETEIAAKKELEGKITYLHPIERHEIK